MGDGVGQGVVCIVLQIHFFSLKRCKEEIRASWFVGWFSWFGGTNCFKTFGIKLQNRTMSHVGVSWGEWEHGLRVARREKNSRRLSLFLQIFHQFFLEDPGPLCHVPPLLAKPVLRDSRFLGREPPHVSAHGSSSTHLHGGLTRESDVRRESDVKRNIASRVRAHASRLSQT